MQRGSVGIAKMLGAPATLAARVNFLVFAAAFATSSGPADSSISVFRFFGSVCVSVYELRDGETKYRPGLAESILPTLRESARRTNKWMRVNTGNGCKKPNEDGFDRELRITLSIKHQQKSIGDRQYQVVLIGASSPTGGVLDDNQLQPTLLVQEGEISDGAIQGHLVEFAEENVIRHMK